MNTRNFKEISAGDRHNLALDETGHIWAWGDNESGQLGNGQGGRNQSENTPKDISKNFGGAKVVKISAGQSHSLAVDDTGNVWAWGSNSGGQVANNNIGENEIEPIPQNISSYFEGVKVIEISAGGFHSLALDDRGRVWAWGYNGDNQLGTGNNEEEPVPQDISEKFGGVNIVQISAGEFHSLALDNSGAVWSWGSNTHGELGNGKGGRHETESTPQNISSMFAGSSIIKVFAGDNHSIALDSNGEIWSWGYNHYGQLGNGQSGENEKNVTPQNISDYFRTSKIVEVDAGSDYSLALDSSGNIWSWGHNWSGQLGNGISEEIENSTPQNISENFTRRTAFVKICTGKSHSLALDSNGAVWTWGSNRYSQLGIGISEGRETTPQNILIYFFNSEDFSFLYKHDFNRLINYLPIGITEEMVKRKNRYILPNYETFTQKYSSILNKLNNQNFYEVSAFLYDKYITFYKITRNELETINQEINKREPNFSIFLRNLKKLYEKQNRIDDLYLQNQADILTQISYSVTTEFENNTYLTLVNIKDKSESNYDESEPLNKNMSIQEFKYLIKKLNDKDIIVNIYMDETQEIARRGAVRRSRR